MRPLTYISIYEAHPAEMRDWINLAHDPDIGLLVNAAELGTRILPDVSGVFFFRPFVLDKHGNRTRDQDKAPLRLRPDFHQAWRMFCALLRPLVASGVVAGFFLGDELIWTGATLAAVGRAARLVSETFPMAADGRPSIVYLNEATAVFTEGKNLLRKPIMPDSHGNPTAVAIDDLMITHLSIDTYTDPTEVERIYQQYVYPRMNAAQRAFIVPQAYGSTYDPHESERQAVASAEGYLEWARRDERIVGINPWHWFSYKPFGCRGHDDYGNLLHNTIGVRDLRALREWWGATGRDIVQHSPLPPLQRGALDLTHTFDEFAEGEQLPSTFSIDPAAESATGLDDPTPPAIADVEFSRTRGQRTSIFLKRPGAAFRYSWGNVARFFEGFQWLPPRTGRQTLKFDMWIDEPSQTTLVVSPCFGHDRLSTIDVGTPAFRACYLAQAWNAVEVDLNLNENSIVVRVNSVAVTTQSVALERTAMAVLFEGGPVFLSNLALRSLLIDFDRSYRNSCEGFGKVTKGVADFGYDAGGWRVDMHPRFLADVTGDGRADIVGFANDGVFVSRSLGDGTFAPQQLGVADFGYDAGGWRVEKHPRFLADVTGDGRADIVGFGDAGVYVSRALGDGTFTAPELVAASFGYNAGGWRVDMHPRFLADVTGDGRADIVGFANDGVFVQHQLLDPPE